MSRPKGRVHTESGAYGVDDWLRIYAGHSHDHAAQVDHVALAT